MFLLIMFLGFKRKEKEMKRKEFIQELKEVLKERNIAVVSRHPATTKEIFRCLQEAGIEECETFTGNTATEDVSGKFIIGNLPLHLAAQTRAVYAVEFKKFPPRGEELTGDLWKEYGMTINPYKVTDIG